MLAGVLEAIFQVALEFVGRLLLEGVKYLLWQAWTYLRSLF
jgi:hypothetical protein